MMRAAAAETSRLFSGASLQQRGCHIDVVRGGSRRGAGRAGEAGAPDEMPAAGECDTRSAQSPGLSLPKSRTHVTSRRPCLL